MQLFRIIINNKTTTVLVEFPDINTAQSYIGNGNKETKLFWIISQMYDDDIKTYNFIDNEQISEKDTIIRFNIFK